MGSGTDSGCPYGLRRLLHNERHIMKHQMELSLTASTPAFRRAARRQRRLPSAHWWFDQMRKAVDAATDWEPAQPGRPEQRHLRLVASETQSA